MRFTVTHDAHYEWQEVDGRPGDGPTIALANGGTAERVTVADERVTHGYLPEHLVEEYQRLQDAYGGVDAGLSIPEVTERYVRFLMARHAPRESWTAMTQEHDELHPDLHAALVGPRPAKAAGGKAAKRPGKDGPKAEYRDLSPRTSIFGSRVIRRDGTRGLWSVRHNLRTTSADWRSCLDWESKVLAGDTFVGAKGTATTAPTATTFTLDGVSAPGSTTAYNGHIIATTSGTNCYGVVLSNTNAAPPVLTIDLWHDPASPGAAAVTTPTAGAWQLMPGNAPAWYLALAHNAGVQTPAASDLTLANEIVTGATGGTANTGLARSLGAQTHTSGTTTLQVAKLFTASGNASTSSSVAAEAMFNAANGGAMPFESAEPSPPTLVPGDTLQQSVAVTY